MFEGSLEYFISILGADSLPAGGLVAHILQHGHKRDACMRTELFFSLQTTQQRSLERLPRVTP